MQRNKDDALVNLQRIDERGIEINELLHLFNGNDPEKDLWTI